MISLSDWTPVGDTQEPTCYRVMLKSKWGPYPVHIVYDGSFKRDKWRIEYGVNRLKYLGGCRTSYDAMRYCETFGDVA